MIFCPDGIIPASGLTGPNLNIITATFFDIKFFSLDFFILFFNFFLFHYLHPYIYIYIYHVHLYITKIVNTKYLDKF